MKFKVVKSVLHNFLAICSSLQLRCHGYWIYGVIINEFDSLIIDLLVPLERLASETDMEWANRLFVRIFQKQMQEHKLPIAGLSSAQLEMTKLGEPVNFYVAHRDVLAGYKEILLGYKLRLKVTAVSHSGKTLERECVMFVAHYTELLRSGESDTPTLGIVGIIKNLYKRLLVR